MKRTINVAWLAGAAAFLMTAVLAGPPAAHSADGTSVFLVARPEMNDPLFGESVILMLPRSARFPLIVGVIVNKPTTIPLQRLFPHSPQLGNRSGTAYFGGPVDINAPAIIFRADQAPGSAARLADHVYMSLDPEYVSGLMQGAHRVQDFRLYLGRAQWAPEQLHDEMLERSWYMVKAETSIVFGSDPTGIWHALVERARLIPAAASALKDPGPCLFFACGARPFPH
jgi:putative transcriptional regulator